MRDRFFARFIYNRNFLLENKLQFPPLRVSMTFPAILSATANIWSALAGFIIAVFLAYRGKSLLKVSLFACLGVFIVELITGL